MCVAGVGVGDNGLKSSSPVIRNSGGCMDGCVLCVMFVCLSETVKGECGQVCFVCDVCLSKTVVVVIWTLCLCVYQKQ